MTQRVIYVYLAEIKLVKSCQRGAPHEIPARTVACVEIPIIHILVQQLFSHSVRRGTILQRHESIDHTEIVHSLDHAIQLPDAQEDVIIRQFIIRTEILNHASYREPVFSYFNGASHRIRAAKCLMRELFGKDYIIQSRKYAVSVTARDRVVKQLQEIRIHTDRLGRIIVIIDNDICIAIRPDSGPGCYLGH